MSSSQSSDDALDAFLELARAPSRFIGAVGELTSPAPSVRALAMLASGLRFEQGTDDRAVEEDDDVGALDDTLDDAPFDDDTLEDDAFVLDVALLRELGLFRGEG